MPALSRFLPGFVWDTLVKRFRYLDSGRFVSRVKVVTALEDALHARERVLVALVQGLAAGELAPAVWLVATRSLLKWQYLQSVALGAGGFDALTNTDFGRIGGLLRWEYRRLAALEEEVRLGMTSVAQAVARMRGFVGNARREYYHRERESTVPYDNFHTTVERRLLDAGAESCEDCIGYAAEGWQLVGALPVPGEACRCGGNCRCELERQDVANSELAGVLQ